MLLIWIVIGISFFFTIFFISISVDMKSLHKNILNGISNSSKKLNSSIMYNRASKLFKLLEYTERKILSSNIRVFIPYNISTHFLLCIIFSSIAFIWISNYMNMLISLIFSALGFMIPYIVLQLIIDLMNERIKKHSIDFLIILKNYYMAHGDIFKALEAAHINLIEPIKTYVGIMVYEYNHNINPIKCMNNFINKVQYHELKLFFENLKICYIHGGDIITLIDEFIDEISKLNEDSDKEDSEDKILSVGLYALLFLNFIVVSFVLNSTYRYEITNTALGLIVFTLDVLISFYIIYLTLDKPA